MALWALEKAPFSAIFQRPETGLIAALGPGTDNVEGQAFQPDISNVRLEA
jgi:hypothetical protein